MPLQRRVLLILGWLVVGSTLHADEPLWSQFRGPGGHSRSAHAKLPVSWDANKNIRWKAELPGRGLSNPVFAGERIFLTCVSGIRQERLHMLALDLQGKKIWERQFRVTGNTGCHPTTCMAAPTPVTDGERVYALWATGDLACVDLEGNLIWYRSLVGDYPDITNQVGMAASPILVGKTLVVPMENAGDSFVAGLDKLTGQNKWRVERPRDINWCTPMAFTVGERTDVLVQCRKDLLALDPETGKERWSFKDSLSGVITPLVDSKTVYVSGSTFSALRPSEPGAAPEVVWESKKIRSNYASPVLYEGRIYSIGGGIVTCTDAVDGSVRWQHRLQDMTKPVKPNAKPGDEDRGLRFWASPVAAGGKLYIVTETGLTFVLDVKGDMPTTLASNQIEDTFLATPAIVGNSLYLRSDKFLYCIAEK
jgi:outer membrane protein assembly factor BamB